MRVATRDLPPLRERLARRWQRLRHRWYRHRRYRPDVPKTLLWIVGCQRSGTSLMVRLFELDRDAVAFEEYEAITTVPFPGDPVLRPLPEIAEVLGRQRAPLVVAKPLVASQELVPLLDLFPATRAVWMYRHFADVAASSVAHFGPDTPRSDLAPIVAGDPADWRSRHLDPAVRDTIRRLHSPDMPSHDAAALFWLARNSLFLSQRLADDPRVALCRYEDLLAAPAATMRAVYAFLERPYPGDALVREILPGRRDPRDLTLAPAVREACAALLARLDALPRLGRVAGRATGSAPPAEDDSA